MARRRKSDPRRSDETHDFSSEPPLLRQFLKPIKPTVTVSPVVQTILRHTAPTALREVEDRRTYHPQGKNRPAASLDRPTHRLVIPKHPKSAQAKRPNALPRTVQFQAPQKVLVCIRRNTRKEVLHALAKTGKGARARKRRQSVYSGVRC